MFVKEIKDIIKNIINENQTGITGEQLYYEVTLKLGYGLDLKAFDCKSFGDFLNKYASSVCEIR